MQVFLAILSVVGTLVGVALGGYLTMKIQRQRWLADNMKEEYRELLNTLTQSFRIIADFHVPAIVAYGPTEQRAEYEAQIKALIVIDNRLFIADEVTKLNLLDRWRRAVSDIEANRDTSAFSGAVGGIMADITKSAKRILD